VAVSTRSTLRANARSGGVRVLGRRLPVLFLAPSPDLHNPPHEQVLVAVAWCRTRSRAIGPPLRHLLPRSPPASSFHPLSTPRAVARGARGGWCSPSHSLLLLLLVLFPPRPPFPLQRRRSTHYPPHEQLLVGLEVGGARRLVLLSSSSSSSSCFPIVPRSPSSIVFPPTIHPTSSCS
jgi:hypothetical protein